MNQPIPVVICDDSRLARKQLAQVLRGWNVEVTFAEHGLAGLEAIRGGKGDIMFLDLNMPIMDGYQVLERIRGDDLPVLVIVISGDIQPEAQAKISNLGALAFIKKPVEPIVITNILRTYGLLEELETTPSKPHNEVADIKFADYYQEIANVAMGQAAELLAKFLSTFVHLFVPKVEQITPSILEQRLISAVNDEHVLISQGFIGGGVAGESILISNAKPEQVSQLISHSGQEDNEQVELQISLSNVLMGAFISSFSRQLDLSFSKSIPNILYNFNGLPIPKTSWHETIMITVGYQIEDYDIECELLVIFSEDSIPHMKKIASWLL